MSCPPRPLRARPHPLCSPIPACRRFCVPRRPAPAGYCLCPAGRADIGREPARTVPAASPCAPARVIRTALSLRAAGFVRPPREGRILAGIQRPPASPVRPIPAPARDIRTALSLRAAGFVRPPREGWILAGSQRVPCPPRHPARPPASSARPNPARRGFCPPRYPARRPPPGFVRPRLVRSAARVPRAAYPCLTPVLSAASPCARVRIHCAVLSLPAASFFLRSAARVSWAA